MILVFDLFGGLCNQFYDINCAINFCVINNKKFTFRNCSFRNSNLNTWYNENVEKLFNLSFLEKYNNLYINCSTLTLTNDNTYNMEGKHSVYLFTDDFLEKAGNKEYIIMKQFVGLYNFHHIVDNVNSKILPSNRIMDLYNTIKNKILFSNEQYNFIHYRYESDFTNFFNLNVENLKSLILRIKYKFKNPNLRIYIATSNIKKIINMNDPDICNIIITKNEDNLKEYNFEELAFVDYMFGLNSSEVFGHDKSSFSHMLNSLKNTGNYYNV